MTLIPLNLIPFLLAPVAAFFAYEKGNPKSKIPKAVALIIYGAAVALSALWLDLIPAAVLALMLAAGLSMGPGNAIGPTLHNTPPDINRGEKWQKGFLLKNQWAAMFGLGFVRGVGALVLIAFDHAILGAALLTASTLAAPLAVFVTLKTMGGYLNSSYQAPTPEWERETARSNRMWKRQDQLYGLFMGLAAAGAGLYL